jgi:hypothetical protein
LKSEVLFFFDIYLGEGYLNSTTAAAVISDLKKSGLLAGLNMWSAGYDASNAYWSQQVRSKIK